MLVYFCQSLRVNKEWRSCMYPKTENLRDEQLAIISQESLECRECRRRKYPVILGNTETMLQTVNQ